VISQAWRSRRIPILAPGARPVGLGHESCGSQKRHATATGTAQMAGLNILTYLTAYLDECGRNGGKPLTGTNLERFLPWNASPEDLRTWAQPPPQPG